MASPRKTRSQGPAEDIDLDHPAGGAEADALVIGVPPPTRLEKEVSAVLACNRNCGGAGDITLLGSISWTLTLQLAFYSSYHRDGTNKAIHFVFVPALCM